MNDQNNIQLGQGNTPLFRLTNLEKKLKWRGMLWAKAEYQNPTGSFKDRGSAMEVREAIRLDKKGVICASTGNMAASLSAFATKAGLPCIVIVPKDTPKSKLIQTLICGAKLIEMNGNYDVCVGTAEKIAKKKNYLLCGDYDLRRRGQATIGVELALSPVSIDAFICPVGNGTVGCAIAEGFAKSKKFPSFIGVQAKGADPLAIAWETKSTTFKSIDSPQTIASAMNVGNPLDGNLTLQWVKKTGGTLLSVTDEEIIAAQLQLAAIEGIYIEPAAAATVAAVKKMKNKQQSIVLILTGNGMKTPVEFAENKLLSGVNAQLHAHRQAFALAA